MRRCGGGVDFLTESYPSKFDNVITNPPFSLAKEFAERALEISREKVILFAKIQFLEGQQRKDFFAAHPPRSVLGAWFYGRTRHTLALNKAVNSSSQQRKLLT